MKRLVSALALSLLGGCATNGVLVSFWPTDVKPPAYVQVDGHPCGHSLTIRTNVVPTGLDWLEPDLIHELDESGNKLRTWRVPMDQYPVGLEGDWVLLGYGSEDTTMLMVSVDGRIKVSPTKRLPTLEGVECSAPMNKEYFCVVASDSPRRLLAYSPACT